MAVERGTVYTSSSLEVTAEPGMYITAIMVGERTDQRVKATLHYSGVLGVRALSRLVEEATALRDELSAAIS